MNLMWFAARCVLALNLCTVGLFASDIGRPGGKLVIGMRGEPKTLNPVTALDGPSREVIWRMMSDLVSIDRQTQRTVPAVAQSCIASKDRLSYTLRIRPGLKFSDGHPVSADDVLFTFQVYQDDKVNAPQRGLLLMNGKPIRVQKVDAATIRFDLPRPYGAGDRLFDGFAILPRHLLEQPFREGKLAESWNLVTKPSAIAGLGPFRLKQYVPGERVVLEKNPYYWKTDRKGQQLPYLDEIVFLFSASEDSQVLRFANGETDLIGRLTAKNLAALAREDRQQRFLLSDAGASTEYNFLLLNQNETARLKWFRDERFRKAVSAVIDRNAIVKLVYQGRARAISTHVTPGNKLWVNERLRVPPASAAAARTLLSAAGFRDKDGLLLDPEGSKVAFTIAVSASSAERMQMATVIQEDLRKIGISVQIVPLEFRLLIDRVLRTHDYDAVILGLGGGDADPNSHLSVWQLDGPMHLWRLGKGAAADWEKEISHLMESQLIEADQKKRKTLYDRVQELELEHLPFIHLVSPNVLSASRRGLGNLKPAILDHPVLWNCEELFWTEGAIPRQ